MTIEFHAAGNSIVWCARWAKPKATN